MAENKLKILLADDEPEMLELVADWLGRHGHKVDRASDGTRALDCLAKKSYDLAILDISMPEITGMEVLDHIRKTSPQTKIVLMTGYSYVEGDFAKALGADAYLSKPFSLLQVDDVVEKCRKK